MKYTQFQRLTKNGYQMNIHYQRLYKNIDEKGLRLFIVIKTSVNLMWKNLQHQQKILNYLLEIVKTQIRRIIFFEGRDNLMKYFLMKKNLQNMKSTKKSAESLEEENAKNYYYLKKQTKKLQKKTKNSRIVLADLYTLR